MNQLKRILLAGTIVPALALTPIANAFAKSPDKEHGARSDSADDHGKAHGPKGPKAERGGDAAADTSAPSKSKKAEKTSRDTGNAADAKGPENVSPKKAANDAKPTKPDNAAPGNKPDMATSREKTDKSAGRDKDRMSPKENARDNTRSKPNNDDTARDTSRTAPNSNAARDNDRMSPNKGAARENDRTKPNDSNTARDNNRAMPDNSTARDNNRITPNNNAARDNDRRNGNDNNTARDNNRGNANDNARNNRGNNGDNGISPAGAAAIGAAAGFAGGFIAATSAQRIDEIRRDRREVVEDGRTYIREPGRTIVRDGDRAFIVHDENERFRTLGYDLRRERRGSDYVDIVDRPGGVQIVTYTDPDGRLLRRVRRDRSGREFILIDNGVDGRIRPYQDDIVVLPPPPIRVPRDRYIVDYRGANENLLYDTLTAPPLAAPPKRYTLDQIRYSPDVRNYVRSVDINTVNFDSGSWTVPGEATGKLKALATAINRAVDQNPNSVFLIEGYTDAVGNATDNLSLSDRRAQSVAAILTKSFNVPPENLTTQGYGEQNLKVDTKGPSEENRRVVVRNITQLVASNNDPAAQQ